MNGTNGEKASIRHRRFLIDKVIEIVVGNGVKGAVLDVFSGHMEKVFIFRKNYLWRIGNFWRKRGAKSSWGGGFLARESYEKGSRESIIQAVFS